MGKTPPTMRGIILAGVCRFLGSALFGGFISLLIVLLILFIPELLSIDRVAKYVKHLLWLLPVTWGILGIFWFDTMLDTARNLFEGVFGGE